MRKSLHFVLASYKQMKLWNERESSWTWFTFLCKIFYSVNNVTSKYNCTIYVSWILYHMIQYDWGICGKSVEVFNKIIKFLLAKLKRWQSWWTKRDDKLMQWNDQRHDIWLICLIYSYFSYHHNNKRDVPSWQFAPWYPSTQSQL